MVFLIKIDDTVIAQSGLIPPGFSISIMDLYDDSLMPDTYEGDGYVYFYDSETHEKAIVNSTMPITLLVKE